MKKTEKVCTVLLGCLVLCTGSLMAAKAEEPAASVKGTVIEIKEYGNAVLSFKRVDLEDAGFSLGDIVTVTVNDYSEDMPYFNGFYVDRGEYVLVAPVKPEEWVNACIRYESFAEKTNAEVGDPVVITLKEDDGALSVQEANNLVYSTDRGDYDLDRVFCNFRPVVMGDIAEGKLY